MTMTMTVTMTMAIKMSWNCSTRVFQKECLVGWKLGRLGGEKLAFIEVNTKARGLGPG